MRLLAIIISLICLLNANARESYYVSSSTGSDKNPGTEKLPFKTIEKANKTKNNNINLYLKSGDIFFESLNKWNNCTIKSYGKGEKPVICGFKILKNPNAWVKEKGLWKLDLTKDDNFYENNFKKDNFHNKIGCIYDDKRDKIYGKQVSDKNKLEKNGEWYQSSVNQSSQVYENTFRYIYFKYDSNPAILGNLCFSTSRTGISNVKNCNIENIAIIGFGNHGIADPDGCNIKDCDLDIIGGSVLLDRKEWIRYGNGIEFWVTDRTQGNCSVYNCLISRTFDTGSTIQGTSDNLPNPKNISFEKCRFYHCRQAYERYLQCDKDGVEYVNCKFCNNISYMSGDNGFDTPYDCDANLLSYEFHDRKFEVTGNIFYGGNHYFGSRLPKGAHDNTIYMYKGQYLHNPHYNKNYAKIVANGEKDVDEYKRRTGDNSKFIILKKDSKEDKVLKSQILRKIKYKRHKITGKL